MSKDFEKEYIELAQSEIPDLWDRIEAGLTEKSAPESVIATTEKGESDKTPIVVLFKRYAGLAAAILCIALIIPAFIFIHPSGAKSSPADTAVTEAAWEEAAAEGAYDIAVAEACEEGYGIAAEEETAGTATAETEAMMPEAAEEEAVEEVKEMNAASLAAAEDMGETRGIYEDAENDGLADKAVIAEAGAQKEDLMQKAEKKEKDNIIRNVVVQVTAEKSDAYQEDESVHGGRVYTVIICEDSSKTLKKGQQVEVYLPAEISSAMIVGEEFEIDISCESDGEYPYVVTQIR